MKDPIQIMLVDDHQVVRMGLRAYFSTLADIDVVAEAADGDEAIRLCAEFAPDVVLMDLIMPGIDGVATTRAIRAISPRTQVIVLTSHHTDEHIFPAIRAGALSYLLKDVDPDELAEAIRQAQLGNGILHPQVAARVADEMEKQGTDDPFAELTPRELEVLRLIAQGQANADIAETLVISEKTVKSHVGNILSKLHIADRTKAAVLAWREGMMRGPSGT